MKQHIENFPTYLQEGLRIANTTTIQQLDTNRFDTLLLVWMWGSGMAWQIIKTRIDSSPTGIPTYVINEYTVPKRVDEKTLMIVASYSWNTEETVSAMHDWLQKWACMIAVTSWWQLKQFANEHNQSIVAMPSGIEPRAALPYSLAIQLAITKQLWLISISLQEDFQWLIHRSKDNQQTIQASMSSLADKIHNSFPLIYACPEHTWLALRLRQQLNENSRMLCGHHIIPEMNHNELLWRELWGENISTIFLSSDNISERNALRYELTKKVITEKGSSCYDITLQWTTFLQQILSGIYQIDRLSYFTAIKRGVDPNSMEIITRLKGELKKS